ncbi:MAG: prolyl oligopeptidase family serine peptidase [Cellulomonas sp.]|nr:prolyl oligopeptidase family serine peptidase [Cellulomonas sp.]
MSTPFHDLEQYIALPRAGHLVLSPDGSRLVVSVQALDTKKTAYRTAWWEVDPAGVQPARRLTRGAKGEGEAAFTPGGDLLFTAVRPAESDDDDPQPALHLLPRGGGEARTIASRTAGVGGLRVAREAGTVLLTSQVLPGARDEADDEKLRKERKDLKVAAILHTGYPVRYWDHDLGPGDTHAFVAADATTTAPAGSAEPMLTLRDLTPGSGHAIGEGDVVLSPDGRTVVAGWEIPGAAGDTRATLMAIDVATGARRPLVDLPEADVWAQAVSPDGQWVAFVIEDQSSPHRAPDQTIGLVALAGGDVRRLAVGWDRWPASLTWLPDSSGLLVVADDAGRAPIFHVSLADDGVTQLTSDDAAFSDVSVSPDGRTAYAMRASYLAPAHPVRIDLSAALATGPVAAAPLPAPAASPELPGRLTEVETTDAAGTRVRAWLALPTAASEQDPAPLLLWVHGGPLGSWNAWSWRWNPWLLVARGYAVLLPDPALSTGYGQEFIQRGWGAWGAGPYEDLMAITDAVVARGDIDETRTGAMGGSFGGYMANWIAGHTDRFRAIVTHASLWALDQFGPTTDAAFYWRREMTEQMALENSPHRFVEQIATPMLVVHGDKDYRVPIGEGLRLWYELLSRSQLAADAEGRTPHRFLYFPDENHWVLSPQHARLWYQVVEAFLAEHVLGLAGEGAPRYPRTLA